MTVNLILGTSYQNNVPRLEEMQCVQRAADFLSMLSTSVDTVIKTEVKGTEALTNSDMTKAKRSVSRLSMAEKKSLVVGMNLRNFTSSEKRK